MTNETGFLLTKPRECLKCGRIILTKHDIGCEVFTLEHKFKGYICSRHASRYPTYKRDCRKMPFLMPKRKKKEEGLDGFND